MSHQYGIIILAAGNSSRLGQPKQLLRFNEKSLIRYTADEAVKVAGKQVIVVTGAHKNLVEEELCDCPAHTIHNTYWQEGMSSSIYIGLITLISIFPNIHAVTICVSDQPFIAAAIFQQMINEQQQTNKGVVAAAYGGTTGVPVLFTDRYFIELLNLKGSEGAKILLNKFPDDFTTIDFEKGHIDLDTPEDVAQWISNQKYS